MLSEDAIDAVIDRAMTLLEQQINSKVSDQTELNDRIHDLKKELDNFVALVASGSVSTTIANAMLEREQRIQILEAEVQNKAGVSQEALPDRKRLKAAARKELNNFESLIINSDVVIARKAIKSLMTTPDGIFTPLKLGSKEKPVRGKLVFTGQLSAGRMFRNSGTEGRT